jgi:hypothetical protein
MLLRAAIGLFLIVSATRAALAGETWRALAPPPRAGLPAVEVELGYPGGYISTFSSPIRLTAKTGSAPFDGYIGFHLTVGQNRTVDVPVVSRATLPPHSEWTFASWLDVRHGSSFNARLAKRELRVDWLNRNLVPIAEQRIPLPPWSTLRPLRIAGNAEAAPGDQALGESAVVLRASELTSKPQWFAGFSSVIVSTATWFELPAEVREAIFRTPLRVHFVGTLAQMPQMTATDKALLPIELEPAAGQLTIPWLYGARTMPVPITWRAKPGAYVVGASSLPYMVANDAAVFIATEDGLLSSLPAFPEKPLGVRSETRGWNMTAPQAGEILREHRPLIAFVVALLFSVVAVLTVRRSVRALLVIGLPLLLLGTVSVVAARRWVNPREGQHRYTRKVIVAPGVTDVFTRLQDYGEASRAVSAADLTELSRGITRSMSYYQAEVRSSATPPGLGVMIEGGWRTAVRYHEHREQSTPAEIRIVSQTPQELVIDFKAAFPIDYAGAQWTLNGRRYVGQARAGSRSSGRLTVPDRQRVGMPDWEWLREAGPTGATRVTLMQVSRDRTVVIRHTAHPDGAEPAPPYEMTGALRSGTGCR